VAGQGDQPVGETEVTAIEHMVRRCVRVAEQLKAGRAALDA
jgi:hypothetical protein